MSVFTANTGGGFVLRGGQDTTPALVVLSVVANERLPSRTSWTWLAVLHHAARFVSPVSVSPITQRVPLGLCILRSLTHGGDNFNSQYTRPALDCKGVE
jgi:hypothetical protein